MVREKLDVVVVVDGEVAQRVGQRDPAQGRRPRAPRSPRATQSDRRPLTVAPPSDDEQGLGPRGVQWGEVRIGAQRLVPGSPAPARSDRPRPRSLPGGRGTARWRRRERSPAGRAEAPRRRARRCAAPTRARRANRCSAAGRTRPEPSATAEAASPWSAANSAVVRSSVAPLACEEHAHRLHQRELLLGLLVPPLRLQVLAELDEVLRQRAARPPPSGRSPPPRSPRPERRARGRGPSRSAGSRGTASSPEVYCAAASSRSPVENASAAEVGPAEGLPRAALRGREGLLERGAGSRRGRRAAPRRRTLGRTRPDPASARACVGAPRSRPRSRRAACAHR